MSPVSEAAYGDWPSTLSAAQVAAGAQSLSYTRLAGSHCYWLESRSTQGGRNTLMHADIAAGGTAAAEMTANPVNVRSGVHEYGGGAFQVFDGQLVYSDIRDHQLYLQSALPGAEAPRRLSDGNAKLRYADLEHDARRQRLLMVCEDHQHSDLQPANFLCALPLDGSGTRTILAEGHDFYAAPRLSPDGTQLAWLTWDHPRMPWEGSQLWLAEVVADGTLANVRSIAGGDSEAVCQPAWSPDGVLYFVSDRSGWWNLYRATADGVTCVHAREAEFGAPHWQFAAPMYGFASADEIICCYLEQGQCHLARLDLRHTPASLQAIPCEYSDIQYLQVNSDTLLMVAASASSASSVVRMDLASGSDTILASSIAELPPANYLSQPQAISYPSNGRTAHAFFYPPCNPDAVAPAGSLPPLMVIGHGGPTGMATNALRLIIQYWTSRGFALLDVNYGGSSGFGRAYRDALQGQWGVIDVEDCVNGARHLVAAGQVDAQRLVIRGGSAGGYTALCALMFHDVFKAGASYYGVSNLATLDSDSHKFESHYNQYLIAPPPACGELYRQRSPSNHLDKLRCPMIFFQGLDDKVVPPSQSEQMVQALRERHIPVAYLAFEGEGHGFRRAENIQRTLEAELYFYRRVLAIGQTGTPDVAPSPAPVLIENLD